MHKSVILLLSRSWLEGERATARIMGSNSAKSATFAKKTPGVRQAVPAYGVHDPHLEVTFDTMEKPDIFISDKIARFLPQRKQ
jgi:DNA-binding Lrp family transcriptional regulator